MSAFGLKKFNRGTKKAEEHEGAGESESGNQARFTSSRGERMPPNGAITKSTSNSQSQLVMSGCLSARREPLRESAGTQPGVRELVDFFAT